MGDNRTAFSMGDSAHLNPPLWPPSFYSKLSPKPIVKNHSSRNFARMPSYSRKEQRFSSSFKSVSRMTGGKTLKKKSNDGGFNNLGVLKENDGDDVQKIENLLGGK